MLSVLYDTDRTENASITISQEGLRSLLNTIEAELYNSDIYNRATASLETLLDQAVGQAQILLKAVGQEAIRIAFQQFSKTYHLRPLETDGHSQPSQPTPNTASEDLRVEAIADPEPARVEEETDPIFPVTPTPSQPAKKLTKAEQEAQKILEQRAMFLRQIGQQLKQARLGRSLSMSQLHAHTCIPIHQIEALEQGQIDKLPEDVYIRGFIRRLAEVLELDSAALVEQFPEPTSLSVIPSWYHQPKSGPGVGISLSPVHLYLGYTALVAGALGGLALMNQQSTTSTVSADQSNRLDPPQSSSHSRYQTSSSAKPGLKAEGSQVAVGVDIAPPESF